MTRRLGVPLVVNDRPDLARVVRGGLRPRRPGRSSGGGGARLRGRRRPVDPRAGGARRDRGRLRRRRPRVRDADEGGTARRRARVRPLRGRPRARCRGSRSAGSTSRTSATWSPPGARADSRRARDRRCSGPERAAAALRAALWARTLRYHAEAEFGSRSPVAQLAEHPAVNRRVVGSSPTRGVPTLLATPATGSSKAADESDPSRVAKRPLARPLRLWRSFDPAEGYSIGISKRAMMPGSPPLARSSGSGSRVATHAYPSSG